MTITMQEKQPKSSMKRRFGATKESQLSQHTRKVRVATEEKEEKEGIEETEEIEEIGREAPAQRVRALCAKRQVIGKHHLKEGAQEIRCEDSGFTISSKINFMTFKEEA
jgi:hypothetical protein